jgi:hypothetical protein
MTGQIRGGMGVEELADHLRSAAVPAHDVRHQQTFLATDPVIAAVVTNLAVGLASYVISRDPGAWRMGSVAIDVFVLTSIDLAALSLAALAAVCLFRLKLGVLRTLEITTVAGLGARQAVTL